MINYIKNILDVAVSIAEGDLTKDVVIKSDKDALGNSFSEMIENLQNVLVQVSGSALQITAASSQLSSSSQAVSQGATEQAASVEQVSSAMEEFASMVEANSDNAEESNKLIASIKLLTDNGMRQMTRLLDSMRKINESSVKISKIIKVIDDIAFQTNILALNAAVEAARAGEHGRGFDVVAEEVRNLAQRSAGAAKETTDLIEENKLMTQSGSQIAVSTEKVFSEIIHGVTNASNMIEEITNSSREQREGVGSVSTALNEMSNVTQLNAASSEETATASEELAAQAKSLEDLLSNFKLNNTDGFLFTTENQIDNNFNRSNHYKTFDKESHPANLITNSLDHDNIY